MNERELGSILFNSYNSPHVKLSLGIWCKPDPKRKVACRQFNSVQRQRKLTTPTKRGMVVQDSSSDVWFNLKGVKPCMLLWPEMLSVTSAYASLHNFALRESWK